MATTTKVNSKAKLQLVNGGASLPEPETKDEYRFSFSDGKPVAIQYLGIDSILTQYGYQEVAKANVWTKLTDVWEFHENTIIFQRSIKKLVANNPNNLVVGVLTRGDKNWYLEPLDQKLIDELQELI